MIKVLCLTIQLKSFVCTQFECQTFLLGTDRTLSVFTTAGPSGPESNGNQRVIHIPQSSSITRDSSLDCLESYA